MSEALRVRRWIELEERLLRNPTKQGEPNPEYQELKFACTASF